MSWASDHDGSVERLLKVQDSLRVGLIMVGRDKLQTCKATETHVSVQDRNSNRYSCFPVEDNLGQIVGLYDAEQWFQCAAPETAIDNDVQPLTEANIIGVDASIFDFIRQADTNSTCLAVAGSKIAGLISISDLQQLPVRAALFSLLTSLEMAMAYRIKEKWADDADKWLSILGANARRDVEQKLERSVKHNTNIDAILHTSMFHKEMIVLEANFLGKEIDWEDRLRRIRALRNDIAHAKPYADTIEKAKVLCALVRDTFEAKEILLKRGAL